MFKNATTALFATGLALTSLHCNKQSASESNTPDAENLGWSSDDKSSTPNDNAGYRPAGNPESPASTATSTEATNNLSDGEIAAITDSANAAEVEQGQLAQSRAKDSRVRDFASMMVEHHSQARAEQKTLVVKTTESADATQMTRDATTDLQTLKEKTAAEFDLAYLELQIKEHRKLLDALQRELLPSVQDAGLRKYLQDITARVQSHLARAEELKGLLAGPGGGAADSKTPARQSDPSTLK